MTNLIKVLVVDDSALMRKIISDMINNEEDMEVIDTARNGEEMLKKLQKINPDIITLDMEMPVMDGITALKNLKRQNIPVPVLMLSSMSDKGREVTMECLEAGAYDFLPKPSGSISLDIEKIKRELINKIRAIDDKSIRGNKQNISLVNKVSLSKAPLIKEETKKDDGLEQIKDSSNLIKPSGKIDAVVIGASTGGPKALFTLVTALSNSLNVPILIVQHMPPGFTKTFAERLNSNSNLRVVEAEDGMSIEKNKVYIAPGGFHMEVGSDKKIHLNTEPSIWGVRPAVDKLFISASRVYKSNLIGIVLTGMGRDGADGIVNIKRNGGITITEDKSTCTIYGMPKAAFETGMVDKVLPLQDIPPFITKIIERNVR